MKRREFIKKGALGTVGGVAAATALSTPALSKGKKQWIAVSAFGKAGLLGQALNEFSSDFCFSTVLDVPGNRYMAAEHAVQIEIGNHVQLP